MDDQEREERANEMMGLILSKHPEDRHGSVLRRVADARGMVLFKDESGTFVSPFELDLDADLARAARERLGEMADEVSRRNLARWGRAGPVLDQVARSRVFALKVRSLFRPMTIQFWRNRVLVRRARVEQEKILSGARLGSAADGRQTTRH